jgi:acetolactate synthase-1/2/3 large subunit
MAARNTLNGGQVIVDYLIQEKVPYAFGLCGHGNIGFIDALYERADDITTISVHHETVAGFMADVYYRVTGQPTATFTSCGPVRRTCRSRWPTPISTPCPSWR